MLMHHAKTGLDGRARFARRQFAALDKDASLIRHIMAEKNIHQRGLAGTILAKKGKNFSLFQSQ